jgi:transaldolase/glucose-6-phosphate isomerase
MNSWQSGRPAHFLWEIATAIASAVMGINPFNQPDVEASKIATKSLTSEYEKTGKLPSEAPFFEGEGVKLLPTRRTPTPSSALWDLLRR